MFVGWVEQEELLLCPQSFLNVLFPINVLLTTVHHPYVTWGEGVEREIIKRYVRIRMTMCTNRKEELQASDVRWIQLAFSGGCLGTLPRPPFVPL